MKKLLAIALCLLFLTACGRQPAAVPEKPQDFPPVQITQPQPQPAPEPEPQPEPQPVPTAAVTEVPAEYMLDDAVKVSITRPVFDLENDEAETIINEYYYLLEGKVRDYAEGDILSQATAPVSEGPAFTVTAGYEVLYQVGNVLSVRWTVDTVSAYELPAVRTVSAANFDTNTGNLYTFADVFTADADGARAAFVEQARQIIEAKSAETYYVQQWYELADTSLALENFYFTAEGVCVFYSQDDLGTATEVLLTYDRLAEYLEN